MKHSARPFAISSALLTLLLLAYAELYVFTPLANWPTWAFFLPLAVPAFFVLLPAAALPRTLAASTFCVVLAVLVAPLLVVAIVEARRWCCLVSHFSSGATEYVALVGQLLASAVLSILAGSTWRLARSKAGA
jgi:hypothetical protein